MKELNRTNYPAAVRPIKVLQFGEGNFLRAFVDWILQNMNDKGLINAGVVVVQPTPFGRIKKLSGQDGLYTVCLEGIENGERVCQMVVARHSTVTWVQVEELGDTERGTGGFGHTGSK